MQLESKKHLEDIRRAASAILGFAAARTFDDYVGDAMFKSAVERQFEIIGEALNRLVRADSPTAERISHCRRIIAFRNVLIHGYDVVEDHVVWDVVRKDLPALHRQVASLLGEAEK